MKHCHYNFESFSLLLCIVACGNPSQPILHERHKNKTIAETTTENGQASAKSSKGSSSTETNAKTESPASDDSQSLLLDRSLEESIAKTENIALDTAEFKVTGLRAGLEDRNGATIPFISFLPVKNADYYQLARCDANAMISGLFDTLEEVELETVNLEDEIAKMLQNKFWSAVVSNDKCKLIETNLTSTIYSDLTFPDGKQNNKFKYVARACSSSGISEGADTACSNLVSLSPELPQFVNLKTQLDDFIRNTILEAENTIETSAIALAQNSRALAKSVIKCEKENKLRALSLERKKLLTDIISLGARIGSELILNDFSSPLTAAQSLWKKREVLKEESRPLSSILREVFITEKDAQLSCYPAEKIARESQNILLTIEASKRKIASIKATNTTNPTNTTIIGQGASQSTVNQANGGGM